jgi:hypothetical protein
MEKRVGSSTFVKIPALHLSIFLCGFFVDIDEPG